VHRGNYERYQRPRARERIIGPDRYRAIASTWAAEVGDGSIVIPQAGAAPL
jgi:hypothetical protein